jgi:hypothetical protein
MRKQQVIVRVTHEFVEDPAGLDRAYDTWALLLARSLNLGDMKADEVNRSSNAQKISNRGTDS